MTLRKLLDVPMPQFSHLTRIITITSKVGIKLDFRLLIMKIPRKMPGI